MEKKLTIYIVCDIFLPNEGGMQKVAEYSALALSKKHNVVVFAPKLKGYKDELPFKVFRVKALPIHKPDTLIAMPSLDKNLKKFIKNNKPDVIHIHNLATLSKWFAKYGQKHNVPTFLTLHGYVENDIAEGTNIKFIRPIIKKMFFKTITQAQTLLAVSESCQKYYLNLGFSNTKVLRNGSDELIKDETYENYLVEKYSITPNDNILCFVNRLSIIKNIYLMIDALKILKDKNFNFKMLIAGDGPEKSNLENLVNEYNLQNQVFFLGNLSARSKVASVYALGDLHLFPSVKDSAGLSQGEAASQNTPSLCMENCGASEMLVDNENGYVSKNDALSFANRIIEIFSDKEHLKQVGENAKQTLYRTWQDYAIDVEKLYLSELEK